MLPGAVAVLKKKVCLQYWPTYFLIPKIESTAKAPDGNTLCHCSSDNV